MSRTYRAVNEYQTLHGLAPKDDWKKEVRMKLVEVPATEAIYIIVNEWTPEGTDAALTEIIDNKYFLSEDAAWEALHVIASSYDIVLDFDDTTLNAPTTAGIEYESYYIQELTHG